jgi:hypothetical protein
MIKKRLNIASFFCALLLVTAIYAATTNIPTLTSNSSALASKPNVVTFSSTCRTGLILSNRNSASTPMYFKFNDTGTSATALCSATVYDLVLDQNEHEVLGTDKIRAFPITSVGYYTTATTPTARIVGW